MKLAYLTMAEVYQSFCIKSKNCTSPNLYLALYLPHQIMTTVSGKLQVVKFLWPVTEVLFGNKDQIAEYTYYLFITLFIYRGPKWLWSKTLQYI